ncbi:AAA family ATPase [Pseudomonas aeruginosa]|jgi:wobble nucleotide-excising tRNase|uniref:AAA family ATPase n=1 Tax=Pseudomonas aeruginosa TaxID=287 RepID=UPI0005D7707A|nr:AAA family ATPase [Pseudomonas aeruginosa]AKO86131.1 anticodon nuclease [Pseudomonas aeruginosa DSM 50071 = NBRC 12689]KAA5581370.1 AAA family ATPase [Pseudomonas aeruginosa]KMN05165.1 anticodon nuclease [Pseudomonas aeruginosa]MBA4567773.1 AAA family ATPase [Pseudomonas aeruginosa]MBG6597669.1 AAA family ATPase [Pseudomonas aeruginosa]
MAVILFSDLSALAQYLRENLELKKFSLIYAYNGTGKTRLSGEFKEQGKKFGEDREITQRDTLYFNAFTEDLFNWDNDLKNDRKRVLKINGDSRFFSGLETQEMDNRIRPLLNRYADFDFRIDTTEWEVSFSREVEIDGKRTTVEDIKVSRGEENIFIWCFFLAIVQLALDGDEAYEWVKYVYIDDPISSLDENNAIAVAHHLAQLLMATDKGPRVVVSTHHVLFFNVLCNEFKGKAYKHLLKRGAALGSYSLVDTSARPFLHHLSNLVELYDAQASGSLYTHHFNMMRRVMEQTANFLGLDDWKACIAAPDGADKALHKRFIDLMSHGDYSLYEPREMMEENKAYFRIIFRQFITGHPFNRALFPNLFNIAGATPDVDA